MKPSPGVLRFGLYLFVGAWMFALGVLVGRGTSPVTFDTASFQERLRVIVGKIPQEAPGEEKVDLDFYEALPNPVSQDSVASMPLVPNPPVKVEKRVPQPQDVPDAEIPVKRSLKLATMGRKTAQEKTVADPEIQATAAKASASPQKAKKAEEVSTQEPPPVEPKDTGGSYTIQVAAYRAFKDAVTQMSILQEKGFSSYRTKGESNGTTWYRVRTGSFRDFQSAQAELNRLKQAKINGMIIKKDNQ